ncbi:MAG: HGGxSTG domain-containing protein [Terriglobales bacterium]
MPDQRARRSWLLKNGNLPGNPNAAPRCGARTRKGTPCGAPAMRNKQRCRMHGGASTGPRTKRAKGSGFNATEGSQALCCAHGWSGRDMITALAVAIEVKAKQNPEMSNEEVGEGLAKCFLESGSKVGPLKYFQEGWFSEGLCPRQQPPTAPGDRRIHGL